MQQQKDQSKKLANYKNSKLAFLPFLLILIAFLKADSSYAYAKNTHYDQSKKHHRPNSFVNRYHQSSKSFSDFLKWRWQKLTSNNFEPIKEEIKSTKPDLELIKHGSTKNHKAVITWIGHSTLLVQVDGLNILTDPNFSYRASPISFLGQKRHSPLVIKLDDLPRIDFVLISHNHYDHLDLATVRKLMFQKDGSPKFLVPLGVEQWFLKNVKNTILEGKNRNVIAMDWDDNFEIKGKTNPVKIEFLAVQHWNSRSINDRNKTLWGSFAILSPQFRFWFSGDLGYSQDVVDIGNRLENLDLAAISIGAYEPRWFMKDFHINPKEAIQVMQDVKAKKALAIHFRTFENMSDEALDKPVYDLKIELEKDRLSCLEP